MKQAPAALTDKFRHYLEKLNFAATFSNTTALQYHYENFTALREMADEKGSFSLQTNTFPAHLKKASLKPTRCKQLLHDADLLH